MEQELTEQKAEARETTLALIKPDGVARGLTIECIRRILDSGLEIKEKKKIWLERDKAEALRKEIKEKHPTIFQALIDYMTEGPCIALLIEGEDATNKLRKICGHTNPREAERGTIRGDYGDKSEDMKELYKQGKVIKNIIHSSGNLQEAKQEIELILGGRK